MKLIKHKLQSTKKSHLKFSGFIFSLFLLCVSSFMNGQIAPVDSLAGFDEEDMKLHLVNFTGTQEEKEKYILFVKRRYIKEKYNLYSLPSGKAVNQAYQAPSPSSKFSQQSTVQSGTTLSCDNIGFEDGTVSNWTVTGIHAITSTTDANTSDPYGGFPTVYNAAGGGTHSLKLSKNSYLPGDYFTDRSGKASRKFAITSANSFLNLHFAMCFLNYPHNVNSAAKVKIQFFKNNILQACPKYNCYYADNQAYGLSSFSQSSIQEYNYYNEGPYYISYAPWQTVNVDLSSFVGDTIVCEISAVWCGPNVDWAYCYIDMDCPSNSFVTDPKCGIPQVLCSPAGTSNYNWTTPYSQTHTTSCITATTTGVYTLQCNLLASCNQSINNTITYTVSPMVPAPIISFSPSTICNGQSSTLTTVNGGNNIWNGSSGVINSSTSTILVSPTVTSTYYASNACGTASATVKVDCSPPPCENCISSFAPLPSKTYVLSAWVKESGAGVGVTTYTNAKIEVSYYTALPSLTTAVQVGTPLMAGTSGLIIDGWQKIEEAFTIPTNANAIKIKLIANNTNANFDDIRVFPTDGSMKGYVYDPATMRLMAELDERNYATLYEYDEEGKLIRVKKETEKGISTIKESRNNTPVKQ